jgi:predicted nucleic acid-binding protein
MIFPGPTDSRRSFHGLPAPACLRETCDAAYLEFAKREGLPLAALDRDLERAAIAEGVALFRA